MDKFKEKLKNFWLWFKSLFITYYRLTVSYNQTWGDQDDQSYIVKKFHKKQDKFLSFTTEEIFQIMNSGTNSSIHLESFPKIPTNWENKKLYEKWEKIKIIRNVVNAGIEVKRSSKDIGSSLEADIEILSSILLQITCLRIF